MKVFISYGYTPRDQWIEEVIVPTLKAIGCECVTGKNLAGQGITPAIQKLISSSDSLISFVTKRESSKLQTSPSVLQELAFALNHGMSTIAVLEEDLDENVLGLASDHHYLHLRTDKKEECVRDLVEVVAVWLRKRPLELKLLPEPLYRELIPFLNRKEVICQYRTFHKTEESQEQPCKLVAVKGALMVCIQDIDPDHLFQIKLQAGGKTWLSCYESADCRYIELAGE